MTEATLALILAVVSTVAALTSMIIAALAKKDSGVSAHASRRSADAAEVSAVASQEAVAESKRANDRLEAHDLVELNQEVSEALKLEEDGDGGFVLVNHGGRHVRGIEIVEPPPIPLANFPHALDLAPQGRSAAFHLAGGPKSERPEFLLIRWSGLDVPMPLNFPYDVMKSIY